MAVCMPSGLTYLGIKLTPGLNKILDCNTSLCKTECMWDDIFVFLNEMLKVLLIKTPGLCLCGLLPEHIRMTNRMWLWLQLGTTTEGNKEWMETMCKMATYRVAGRGDLFNEVWGLFLTYHTHTDTQVKKSECFLNALYILILNIELSMERTTLKVLWSSSSDSSDTGTFSPLAVIWNGTSEAFFVRSRTSVFTSFWWKWFEN